VKQPGQSIPDTLSYDHPRPQDTAEMGLPAAQPAYPATCELPDSSVDKGRPQDDATARERPLRTDRWRSGLRRRLRCRWSRLKPRSRVLSSSPWPAPFVPASRWTTSRS